MRAQGALIGRDKYALGPGESGVRRLPKGDGGRDCLTP